MTKITGIWITTNCAEHNGRVYVHIAVRRENPMGHGTNRSYTCHSGNDKERRLRFLERGRKMQLAYFEQGV